MLQFQNPDVAAKYISSFKGDPVVHLPGKNGSGFRKKLSTVSLKEADRLFAVQKQNLLQENKSAPAVPKPSPSATKAADIDKKGPAGQAQQ